MIINYVALHQILAALVQEKEAYLSKFTIVISLSHLNQTGQKEQRSSSTALRMYLHIMFTMQL